MFYFGRLVNRTFSSFPFSHHSVLHAENMENRKNTERKTAIKIPKNDGCFFTSSLRKSHTSRLLKQIHKNLKTLDTTVKIEARGGVVSEGKFGDAKIRVTIDTSKIHDKWQKCKSSKKYEKKHQKRAKIAQFL